MSLVAAIIGQFKKPRGLFGRVVGFIMANRPSNRSRNAWTVELLGIGAGDRVLELGCGPGLALAGAAARAPEGRVVGVDHSSVMIGQARRRNRAAVKAGRLELRCQSITALDGVAGPFDKVFSLNVLMFLSPAERAALFRRLRRMMAPGGRIATTYMPRHPGAKPEDAHAFAAKITDELQAAGFTDIATEVLPLAPLPAVCVLGTAPRG